MKRSGLFLDSIVFKHLMGFFLLFFLFFPSIYYTSLVYIFTLLSVFHLFFEDVIASLSD